jgi:lipopolysaccharide transport system ATP-binding protein
MKPAVIRVQGVTQRFRLIQERPDTLRELFAKFFRHQTHYHDFDAVQNVSFDVQQGEMVGIVGRNGSGKSTLLKIIAGVYQPTAGRVEVNGSIAPLIELGAGFHAELTGRENVLMNGLLMGFSKRQMQEREASILEFAGIGDFIDAPVKQYSSGMYMRLAFAVATEVDPDILVVDEILAVGDEVFKQKCFDRLERFRKAGKTILFVTHSLSQVVEHCDRAIYLEKGRLVADGEPEHIVDLYLSASAIESTDLVNTVTH